MARKKLPDYDNCITCLANSILKKFGVEQNGKSLEMLDRYLEKEYQNIVVIVLDAMVKRQKEWSVIWKSRLNGWQSNSKIH